MTSPKNDSDNSEKSDPGSKVIFISKPPLKSDRVPPTNDDIEPSSNSPFIIPLRHPEHQYTPPYVYPMPTRDVPPREVLEEGQLFRERIPPRTKSSPNLTNNAIPRNNFQAGLRRRMCQLRSQSVVDMKYAGDSTDDNPKNSAPLYTSAARPVMRTQPVHNLGDNEPRQAVLGRGVLGLISRFTSILRLRNPLDEGVLNNFNMEVGTVASRVDMWRQRLEEERTNSIRSYSRSIEAASPHRSSRSIPANPETHAFITGEIYHLLQLTKGLASSLSGTFTSWGWLGIEDKLMVLLEMGSNMVFPVAEILVMNIFRMLREILDLHGDDTEKNGGISSIIEAINNAFYAIRSLIHLGKAYQNAYERSDSDYTGEDSRSALARSLSNFDQKP